MLFRSLTALKQLPSEIEATAASVKLPQYKLFFKVTLPVCLPAILDIATYLFVNALTTTSAVVFLYSTDTIPASVSILNMDDAGQTGAAAAMAVMIMIAAAIAKIVANGKMPELWDKWFLKPIPPKNIVVGLELSPATKNAWANLNDKPAEDYVQKK